MIKFQCNYFCFSFVFVGSLVIGPPLVLYLFYYINIGLSSEAQLRPLADLTPRRHYVDNTETKYILTWCEAYGSLKYGWEFGEDKFRQVRPGNIQLFLNYFSEQRGVRSPGAFSPRTGTTWAPSRSLTPSSSIRDQSSWRTLRPSGVPSRDMSSGCLSLPHTPTTTLLRPKNWQDSSTGAWATDSTPTSRDLTEVLKRFNSTKIYVYDLFHGIWLEISSANNRPGWTHQTIRWEKSPSFKENQDRREGSGCLVCVKLS